MPEPLPEAIAAGLVAMGLLASGQQAQGEALAGGVSSDIWHLKLPDGREICVKRALPKLKVAADWRAPVVRNIYEARWLREADRALPGAVPKLLGQDEATGALAMEFLSPADHPVWKARSARLLCHSTCWSLWENNWGGSGTVRAVYCAFVVG